MGGPSCATAMRSFSLRRQIPVGEYDAVKEFLNAVAKADAVQLVFFTK